MEPYWDPNGHVAPHAVKYESDTTVSGFAYCNEGGLNFAASAASAYSEDDADFGSGRRGKASRQQDPLSHRIIEKRRRDRMNSCLADLSRLIPPQYQRKGRGRIEKTEIIEMSIRYMKQLQHQEYLHKENLYKLGYEECLQQAANYLYTGQHRDICYQMVDHLKEVLKGDCLKIRIHNSALDSVSASSGSPPSSHHHLNGTFHPVAPLSQLREMLTASDTEHSSDLHDLHDGQHSDDAGGEMPHLHPHHRHLHNSLHEDAHDGHGHHVPQMQALQQPQQQQLQQQQQQQHQVPQQQQQPHIVPKPAPEPQPALSMHDDDDVKDLSLRRCPLTKLAAVPLAPSLLANGSTGAGAAPTDIQPVQPQPLQPCKRPASNHLHHPMDVATSHPADFASSVQPQPHQQPHPQRLQSDCSNSTGHHHNSRSPPLPSARPTCLSSGIPAAAVHSLLPPSTALGALRGRHHDLRPPHDADDDPDADDLHDDELTVPGQRQRQRKLSHDTSATCAHDMHDHHHSYKFKNYIQQRFSQDTHTNDLGSRTPSPIAMGLGLGLGGGGGSSSDCKKPKLCMDFEQSVSCDEKPSVNGDCKPEVSAFPMFKTMQLQQQQQQQLAPLVATSAVSPVPPPPSFALLSAAKSAAGQMVPIFALHSHGRFYVPLSVEYAALQPYLGGIDLLLDAIKPVTGAAAAPLVAAVASASATASVIQPPLHSINISVNFGAVGGAMGGGGGGGSGGPAVASVLRPKVGGGLSGVATGNGIGGGGTMTHAQSVVQGIGSDGW